MFNLKENKLKEGALVEEQVKPRKTFMAPSLQVGAFEKFEHGKSMNKGTPFITYYFVGSNKVEGLQSDFDGRQHCKATFWLTEKVLGNMDSIYNPIVFFAKIADQIGLRAEYEAAYVECTNEEEFATMLKSIFMDKEFIGVIAGEEEEFENDEGNIIKFIKPMLNYSTICRANTDEGREYLENYLEGKGDRLVRKIQTSIVDANTADTGAEDVADTSDDDLPF